MSKLAAMQALAAQAAEVGDNMTEVQKGGGGRLLPEGNCIGVLVEYIELGQQPQEYGGKAKEPALEFRLGFALYGPGYQNEDGTPYVMYTFDTSMSRNEKAGAFLLFKSLNWTNRHTHFSQMLGEAFIVNIIHKQPEDKTKKVQCRINTKGFLPPLDPLSKMPYPVPAVPDDLYKLFIWNLPTKDGWDSLYQEGQFDDGGSKNKTQIKLVSALDFAGSPLESLLLTSGSAIPAVPKPAATAALPAQPATPTAAQAVAVAAPLVQPAATVVQPVAAAIPATQVATTVAAPVSQPQSSPTSTTTSPSNPVVQPAAVVVPQFAALPQVAVAQPA